MLDLATFLCIQMRIWRDQKMANLMMIKSGKRYNILKIVMNLSNSSISAQRQQYDVNNYTK